MSKTILIAGFGPGISTGVAEKFGSQGYAVALVARSTERLNAGVQALEAKGIRAAGFTADLSDTKAVPGLVQSVRDKLGPIGVVHWNAYAGGGGDLLTGDPAALRAPLDIATTSLVAAVQAALPDLRAAKGAVLVTNGGFGLLDAAVDTAAVQYQAMGLALANAAKHKLVRLLSERLKADGIYVGEVLVLGSIKGTPWDQGNATLEGSTIGAKFWEIFSDRRELSVKVG
jgi:NADP-dependent 3-hydroxy acid dehydrogenase YdfG